ncbi:uncharacterized protein TNCV_3594881 [Trichonephila clavipes]|nr:uncharacterized protein TNCV_3594881 [Trichonephila clavipes]
MEVLFVINSSLAPHATSIEKSISSLVELTSMCKNFVLQWIPSYYGILGNEKTDSPAENGTTTTHPKHLRPSRFDFSDREVGGAAGLGCLQEVYFSGSEKGEDFIEGIDIPFKLLEIPSDLLCAYLKDHLLGRASYWCEIFGSIKKLGLSISKNALVDHIFVRLKPQVLDYVEVRNPETTAQLLEVLAKFEERYAFKKLQGLRNSENVGRRVWNECRISTDDNRRTIGEVRKFYINRIMIEKIIGVITRRNQWVKSRNGFNWDYRRFNNRGYQSGNRVQSESFSRGERRNRGFSTNFSRGNQSQGDRLNVLSVRYVQNYQSLSAKEFVKPWMFLVMADLEYPCILDVDFISGSKIVFEFDRKVLVIPDSNIEIVGTTIEEGNVDIDLTKTGLEESQKQELQDLFNPPNGLLHPEKSFRRHLLLSVLLQKCNSPFLSIF